MPKPVLATSEELNQCHAELLARVEQARQEASQSTGGSEGRLQGAISAVTDTVTRNAATAEAAVNRVAADQAAYTDAEVEKSYQKITAFFPPIENRITQEVDAIYSKIDAVDRDVRAVVAEELSLLCERFDKELQGLKQELLAKDAADAKLAADNLANQRNDLSAMIEQVRKEFQKSDADLDAKIQAQLGQINSAWDTADQKQNKRSERAEAEIWLKLDKLEESLKLEVAAAASDINKVEIAAADNLRVYGEKTDQHLDDLEAEAQKLRDAVTEVENQPTREVNWVIKNVSQRIRPSSASQATLHTSWFSPKFNAAGAHGLQLELQLFRPSDPPVEGSEAGDCAVFLWACKGMTLSYKLTIGNKSSTMEKVFNGRVPYGTKRFCWLRDQVNREDDTLTVSIEIQEAIREVEHPIKALTPPQTDGMSQQEHDELCAAAERSLEGTVVFRRHINNRMLDQVKNYVELMRSRMIRKVEWRIEHASLLRRCFPPSDPICSSAFNMAGIEGMQLIFYPSGYTGTADGFCSFFLFCPAGTTIKCALYLGSQRRDVSTTFEEEGAFGRTNFCRYDACLDEENDVILVSVEVEEAHQEVRAKVAHHPTNKKAQPIDGGSSPAEVKSIVKLQKNAGKPQPGLDEVRVLPSLWTNKSMGDVGTSADGLHQMAEIRAKARGPRAPLPGAMDDQAGFTVTTIRDRTAGMTGRSVSTPAFNAEAERTFLRGEDEDTRRGGLPKLASTNGGDWSRECLGGTGGKRKSRSSRRKGGLSSTASSAMVSPC